jgi:hypothetical protein
LLRARTILLVGDPTHEAAMKEDVNGGWRIERVVVPLKIHARSHLPIAALFAYLQDQGSNI